jgi:hypothetical protein
MSFNFHDFAETIFAIAALVAAFKGVANGKSINDLHLAVNSRLDQLLNTTAQNATLTERAAVAAERASDIVKKDS